MAFNVQYEGRSVELLKFLSLNILADVKERVWDENDVSERLFINNQVVMKQSWFSRSQNELDQTNQLRTAVLKALEKSILFI